MAACVENGLATVKKGRRHSLKTCLARDGLRWALLHADLGTYLYSRPPRKECMKKIVANRASAARVACIRAPDYRLLDQFDIVCCNFAKSTMVVRTTSDVEWRKMEIRRTPYCGLVMPVAARYLRAGRSTAPTTVDRSETLRTLKGKACKSPQCKFHCVGTLTSGDSCDFYQFHFRI